MGFGCCGLSVVVGFDCCFVFGLGWMLGLGSFVGVVVVGDCGLFGLLLGRFASCRLVGLSRCVFPLCDIMQFWLRILVCRGLFGLLDIFGCGCGFADDVVLGCLVVLVSVGLACCGCFVWFVVIQVWL